MNRIKLPINEITVEDRQRQDLGDINELAESLKRFGLIQPIVISQEKRLLAGGRRVEAAKSLGWTDIDVVYKETLTLDEAFEIELEENVRRKDMSWQERCLNLAKIHELKRKRGALAGSKWGLAETGELFGVSKASISNALTIAEYLLADTEKKGPFWLAQNMFEAWRIHLKKEEDAIMATLAARQQQATEQHFLSEYVDGAEAEIDHIIVANASPTVDDLEKEDARERYLKNPLNDPNAFESYWAEKQAAQKAASAPIVYISRILHKMDCLEFMARATVRADHIITDIPYGNDMANLDTTLNIDTIEKEHEQQYVRDLMVKFFPAAYNYLKDTAFLCTWCDQELWQFMYDLAIKAGFAVQRWPVTWNKTHRCRNNAAQYNFTKSTEIAMICRKGNITLAKNQPVSSFQAANDELCDAIDHPFAKPYAAWEFLFEAVSIPGQIIYDPFAGEGSGVISFLRGNRSVVATEINEVHYNKSLENVKRLHYLPLNPNFRFL